MNTKVIFNIFFLVFLGILILSSCDKVEEQKVTYLITGLKTPYFVTYLNEEGVEVNLKVTPKSSGEQFIVSFFAESGDLVYLYSKFYDQNLIPTVFKHRILLNGKVFKEAYNYDKESLVDSVKTYYIRRSGTVPY